MRLYRAVLLGVLAALFLAPAAAAAEEGEEFSAVHHSADGYYLDFLPIGKIELPRLFLVRHADGGFGFEPYLSTAAALRSGKYRAIEGAHGGGSEDHAEAEAHATAETHAPPGHATADAPLPEYEQLIRSGGHLDARIERAEGSILFDFSITRHLIYAILGALLVAALFIGLARRYKRGVGRSTAPRGFFQNAMETVIVFIRDEIAKPNLGYKYPKYLPYLLTLFFFILTCNLLGLVPFGATATSNITVTAVLAIFTFLVTQLNGSRDHWQHVFNPPGVPWFIKPIMVPIEIIGLFTKPFALAVRLFANMTAGHLVILSLIGLIFTFTNLYGTGAGWGVAVVSVAFSLFIYLLEILVALIQAYIFTMLSALFIGMAVEEHVHDERPDMAEGDVPPLEEDPADVTPHPLGSRDESNLERRTRVERPEPAAA